MHSLLTHTDTGRNTSRTDRTMPAAPPSPPVPHSCPMVLLVAGGDARAGHGVSMLVAGDAVNDEQEEETRTPQQQQHTHSESD